MTESSTSRFPALAPQAPLPRPHSPLGLSLTLPLGELAAFLTSAGLLLLLA